jgi:hypothetical protein
MSFTDILAGILFQPIKINVLHIIRDKDWLGTRPATVLFLFRRVAGKEYSFMPRLQSRIEWLQSRILEDLSLGPIVFAPIEVPAVGPSIRKCTRGNLAPIRQ